MATELPNTRKSSESEPAMRKSKAASAYDY